MASERKILANRQNASRSTGPRSANGKARSKLNAMRHGLATRITNTKLGSGEIRRLMSSIAHDSTIDDDTDATFSLAEAELDIVRVRIARVTLLENTKIEENFDRGKIRKSLDQIYAAQKSLAPFESSELPGGRILLLALENSLEELLATPISTGPVDPEIAFAVVLTRLAIYDRYESRAMNRRRRSIRKLDGLQKSFA